MADDSTAPATKQDIAMIMEMMAEYYQKLEIKTELWKAEIIHEFHIVAEDIRHDALGANKDKIGVLSDRSDKHETRITRLEKHAGLVAV